MVAWKETRTGEWRQMGMREFLWLRRMVLELDCGDGCRTLGTGLKASNVHR